MTQNCPLTCSKCPSPVNDDAQFPEGMFTCAAGQRAGKTKCDADLDDLYDRIVDHVGEFYDRLNAQCTNTNCPRGDLAGCVVRLVGHDFMDFNPKSSGTGADACIDFEDPDNKGLKSCLLDDNTPEGVPAVQGMWQKFCTEVSLADFFVITAEALIGKTLPNNQRWLKDAMKKQFQFGRKTGVTCNNNMVLPNPEESCDAVDKNFRQSLGLTWTQATALMGVHTLGRAERKNSGFHGPWVNGPHAMAFNNKYYIDMVGAPWTPERISQGKTQWRRADLKPGDGGQSMMLNTDLCLAWSSSNDVTASKDGKICLWSTSEGMDNVECQCKGLNGNCTGLNGLFGRAHQHCCAGNDGPGSLSIDHANSPFKQEAKNHPESSTAAKLFAKNETAWLKEFQVAWKKSTEIGTTGLCQKQTCKDKNANCPRWKQYCGRSSWMTQNCPLTCSRCR